MYPNCLFDSCSQSSRYHDGWYWQPMSPKCKNRRRGICCMARQEFGEDEVKLAIIVRALYGLKSSGTSCLVFTFCNKTSAYRFHSKLHGSGYASLGGSHTRRFQILWTHASLYSYIDDILRISKDLTKIIHSFADPHFLYRLKNVGPPKMWYLSAEEYLVNAIPVILEESFGPLKQTIIQNEQVRCSSSTRLPSQTGYIRF
jgi:hypothetical protein